MLIKGGITSLDEVFEAFATAKCVHQDREFDGCRGFEVGKRVGGAHDGFVGHRVDMYCRRCSVSDRVEFASDHALPIVSVERHS